MENNLTNIFIKNKITAKNISNLSNIFPAVIASIIFSKEMFKHNDDIKAFTNDQLKLDYKEYVFAARPYLYSRIINDIYIKDSSLHSNMIIVQEFIKSYNNQSKKIEKKERSHKNKSQSEIINEWSNLINPKDDTK